MDVRLVRAVPPDDRTDLVAFFRQVVGLHPRQRLGHHRQAEEILEIVRLRCELVGGGVLVPAAPVVRELQLQILGRHVFREHPQVPQGQVRIVVAPVRVAVLQEYVAVAVLVQVPEAAVRRHVQVDAHIVVQSRGHLLEQAVYPHFGRLVVNPQPVHLERADAVETVQADEPVGVVRPARVVVVVVRLEPHADLDAQFTGLLHDRREAVGEAHLVRQPVVRIVPVVLRSGTVEGEVLGLGLPAVVQLVVRDAQPRAAFQLLEHIFFRQGGGRLGAVAPGVHHHHFVPGRVPLPQPALIGFEGAQCGIFRTVADTGHGAVALRPAVGGDIFAADAQTGHPDLAEGREVVSAHVLELGVGRLSLFQEEQPLPRFHILREQHVAAVQPFVIAHDILFPYQVVQMVRHFQRLHDAVAPMFARHRGLLQDRQQGTQIAHPHEADVRHFLRQHLRVIPFRRRAAPEIEVVRHGRAVRIKTDDPPDFQRVEFIGDRRGQVGLMRAVLRHHLHVEGCLRCLRMLPGQHHVRHLVRRMPPVAGAFVQDCPGDQIPLVPGVDPAQLRIFHHQRIRLQRDRAVLQRTLRSLRPGDCRRHEKCGND